MHDKGYLFFNVKPPRFIATKISIQGDYIILQNAEFKWDRELVDYGVNKGKYTCYCVSFPTDERGTNGFHIPKSQVDMSSMANAKESIRLIIKDYWQKLKDQHAKDDNFRTKVTGFTSIALEDNDTLSVV
mgnify:FL=1